MKHIKLLTGARSRVEKGWTQGTYARRADGRSVPTMSKDAVCFCSLGATDKEYYSRRRSYTNDDLDKAFGYLVKAFSGKISHCNDIGGTTQLHVEMAFDFAILMAQDDMEYELCVKGN